MRLLPSPPLTFPAQSVSMDASFIPESGGVQHVLMWAFVPDSASEATDGPTMFVRGRLGVEKSW